MEVLEVLSRNTAILRKEKNWSQEELANKMQVHQSQISRIEKGSMISVELLVKLADALGVSPNELLRPQGTLATPIDEKVVEAALRLPPEDKELLVYLIDALHRKNQKK